MNQNGWHSWYGLDQLDHDACMVYLNWVMKDGAPGDSDNSSNFLLAHCHDGVCWGRMNADRSWRLSCSVFPELSPCVSVSNLLEIRLFGMDKEVLIWRIDKHLFSGRCLFDKPEKDENEATRPDDEVRILLGSKVIGSAVDGFSRVKTDKGTDLVVPLDCTAQNFHDVRWPFRLMLRHYFEEDKSTGVVRVAASRLMDVRMADVSKEVN